MLQKNANPKSNHGKGKPAPSGAFTHRIREDGEVSPVRKVARPPLTLPPLPPWQGLFACDRLTAIDLFVRYQKGSRCQPTTPGRSPDWKSDLLFPQVVVPNNKDYPPLKQRVQPPNARLWLPSQTPLLHYCYYYYYYHWTSPLRTLDFADAVKRRPTHQQLVERQPEFRKAGAAAWLALKRENFSPCTQCTESGALFGSPTHLCKRFPYAKPGDLRKAMQGARIRTSAVALDATIVKSFKAWIPRPRQLTRISSLLSRRLLSKTVTTIQRSPDVKARNFFRSLLASIGGKTLEAATAEATKIRVQTPDFSISTLETVPKESLPVKKATDKEPAAPAVDPPSDMAAEVTPAIQDDGVTPTVTPIADVEMCL
ncbi:hypothetical protein BASA83_013494 [Batrachochytrium salamandrivorans]|nr:hypothetical protein BASA83_013494 [Batrachochytrium salamandrivorans]